MPENNECRRLERTPIGVCSGDNNPDIEDDSENNRGNDVAVDVFTDHTYRDRLQVRTIWSVVEKLDEQPERPFLEAWGLHCIQSRIHWRAGGIY